VNFFVNLVSFAEKPVAALTLCRYFFAA